MDFKIDRCEMKKRVMKTGIQRKKMEIGGGGGVGRDERERDVNEDFIKP